MLDCYQEEALQWIKSKKIRVKGLSNSDKVIIKAKWSVSESGLKSGDLLFVHLGEDHQTLGEISQSSGEKWKKNRSFSKASFSQLLNFCFMFLQNRVFPESFLNLKVK